MAVRFTILGSGSGGNCAYLECGETRLLIDAGFSARQIRERLASIGRAPEGLSGILITHEHGDHIQGLGVLAGKLGIPVYANRLTREAIEHQFPQSRLAFALFETGGTFSIGDVEVRTFSVPHDAMDPVGFVLATTAGELGFLTDLGHVTRLILERVRSARWLVLEANHDLKLLQDDLRRPWGTKQRILSRHGHLSNDAAAEVAVQLAAGGGLQRIYLGHLSRDCNRPDLALKAVSRKLQDAGASNIEVHNTSQETPSPTLDLDPAAQTELQAVAQGATFPSTGLPEASATPPAVRSSENRDNR